MSVEFAALGQGFERGKEAKARAERSTGYVCSIRTLNSSSLCACCRAARPAILRPSSWNAPVHRPFARALSCPSRASLSSFLRFSLALSLVLLALTHTVKRPPLAPSFDAAASCAVVPPPLLALCAASCAVVPLFNLSPHLAAPSRTLNPHVHPHREVLWILQLVARVRRSLFLSLSLPLSLSLSLSLSLFPSLCLRFHEPTGEDRSLTVQAGAKCGRWPRSTNLLFAPLLLPPPPLALSFPPSLSLSLSLPRTLPPFARSSSLSLSCALTHVGHGGETVGVGGRRCCVEGAGRPGRGRRHVGSTAHGRPGDAPSNTLPVEPRRRRTRGTAPQVRLCTCRTLPPAPNQAAAQSPKPNPPQTQPARPKPSPPQTPNPARPKPQTQPAPTARS